jgi:hypothetical protein
MFRHVLVLKLVEGFTPAEAEKAVAALAALPTYIPELREMKVGIDLGLRDTAWDIGLVALFDNATGWRAYLDHPEHLRVSHDLLTPLIAERASVQMEV